MIEAGFGPLAADCFGGVAGGRALLVRRDGPAGVAPGRWWLLRSGMETPLPSVLMRLDENSTAVPSLCTSPVPEV